MQEEHLAIAFVPTQKWGAIYEDEQALKVGTIFQELNKPFFAAPSEPEEVKTTAEPVSKDQREREELMTKIMQVSFVIDDLALYLDTHENDEEAVQIFLQKEEERAQLKKEFAELFYPLTRECIPYAKEEGKFGWQCGPMPWEGACV